MASPREMKDAAEEYADERWHDGYECGRSESCSPEFQQRYSHDSIKRWLDLLDKLGFKHE